METIKNVVGYVYGSAKTNESHEEPVNGQQGAGTAAEPFDKGNEQNDAKLTGASTATPIADTADGTTVPDIHEPVRGNVVGATSASDRPDAWRTHTPKPSEQYPLGSVTATETDETPAATTSSTGIENMKPETDSSTAQTADTTSTDTAKSGGIGSSSWFSTALPSVGGKRSTDEPAVPEQSTSSILEKDTPAISESTPQAQPSASSKPAAPDPSAQQTSKEANTLPPNHLPDNVPVGASTDLLPNQGTPETIATAAGTSSTASSSSNTTAAALPTASEPTPSSDAPSATDLPGTKAPIHSSKFTENEDADAHIRKNPEAIPTAGGIPIGVTAIEERTGTAVPLDSTQVSPRTSIGGSHSSAPAKPLVSEAKNVETASPSSSKVVAKAEDDGEELHGKDKLKAKLHRLKEKIKH